VAPAASVARLACILCPARCQGRFESCTLSACRTGLVASALKIRTRLPRSDHGNGGRVAAAGCHDGWPGGDWRESAWYSATGTGLARSVATVCVDVGNRSTAHMTIRLLCRSRTGWRLPCRCDPLVHDTRRRPIGRTAGIGWIPTIRRLRRSSPSSLRRMQSPCNSTPSRVAARFRLVRELPNRANGLPSSDGLILRRTVSCSWWSGMCQTGIEVRTTSLPPDRSTGYRGGMKPVRRCHSESGESDKDWRSDAHSRSTRTPRGRHRVGRFNRLLTPTPIPSRVPVLGTCGAELFRTTPKSTRIAAGRRSGPPLAGDSVILREDAHSQAVLIEVLWRHLSQPPRPSVGGRVLHNPTRPALRHQLDLAHPAPTSPDSHTHRRVAARQVRRVS